MENLTQKLKDKSVKKWERILKDIKNKVKRKSYYDTYWECCGFCEAAKKTVIYSELFACSHCDLNKEVDDKDICGYYGAEAIQYADKGDWDIAEEYAKIVLKAIKKAKIEKLKSKKKVKNDKMMNTKQILRLLQR